jgi:hypothetical protein
MNKYQEVNDVSDKMPKSHGWSEEKIKQAIQETAAQRNKQKTERLVVSDYYDYKIDVGSIPVTIDYIDRVNDEIIARNVDITAILSRRSGKYNNMYFGGFCHLRNDECVFSIESAAAAFINGKRIDFIKFIKELVKDSPELTGIMEEWYGPVKLWMDETERSNFEIEKTFFDLNSGGDFILYQHSDGKNDLIEIKIDNADEWGIHGKRLDKRKKDGSPKNIKADYRWERILAIKRNGKLVTAEMLKGLFGGSRTFFPISLNNEQKDNGINFQGYSTEKLANEALRRG